MGDSTGFCQVTGFPHGGGSRWGQGGPSPWGHSQWEKMLPESGGVTGQPGQAPTPRGTGHGRPTSGESHRGCRWQ